MTVNDPDCTCRDHLEDMHSRWTCPACGFVFYHSDESKLAALYDLNEIDRIFDPIVKRINELTREIRRR